MELTSIKPQTITLHLKHPETGAKIGVAVELQSLKSEPVKAAERVLKNQALKGGRNNITAEKIDDNTYTLLAACIVSWKFGTGEDGSVAELDGDKAPECNRANKAKLLGVGWIADQIDAALGDETAFFTGSKNS